MRIDGAPKVQTTSPRRDARATGSGQNFADAVASESQPASTPPKPAAPAAIDGLFLLQEVADELTGRRRAAARGSALLDRLDDLRLGLLAGKMPRAQLEQLRTMASEHGLAVDDPALAAVLAEIETRVAVELAKLDRLA